MTWSVGNSSIDNGYESHVFAVKLINELGKSAEITWIVVHVSSSISEVSVLLHVVDVDPLGVERDLVVQVALARGFDVSEVPVAPLALVPSKSPLRDQDGVAY